MGQSPPLPGTVMEGAPGWQGLGREPEFRAWRGWLAGLDTGSGLAGPDGLSGYPPGLVACCVRAACPSTPQPSSPSSTFKELLIPAFPAPFVSWSAHRVTFSRPTARNALLIGPSGRVRFGSGPPFFPFILGPGPSGRGAVGFVGGVVEENLA